MLCDPYTGYIVPGFAGDINARRQNRAIVRLESPAAKAADSRVRVAFSRGEERVDGR